MTIDIDVVAKVLSGLITAGLAITKYMADAKPKLIVFFGHRSEFQLKNEAPAPPFDIYTHGVVITNTGKKTAFNIRLGHLHMPTSVTVIPRSITYKVEINAEGYSELLIPTLVAKEEVTISYLYSPPITWRQINTYVKSDEGPAKVIETLHFAAPSRSRLWLVKSLMFVGALSLVYWGVRFVYWLALSILAWSHSV